MQSITEQHLYRADFPPVQVLFSDYVGSILLCRSAMAEKFVELAF